jgi:ABC-2 type transport system permease protein
MYFLIRRLIRIWRSRRAAAQAQAQIQNQTPGAAPTVVAAYSVVGERQQGTLEPVLTTPLRREEFMLGKALAALVPSLAISYGVYVVVVACVELFAKPGVAPELARWPELLAQLLFTPLLAGWSIWVGIAISTRFGEVRVAQQLGALASFPSVLVTALIAYGVIRASLALAIGGAVLLLLLNGLGWRITSAAFQRERLISSTR